MTKIKDLVDVKEVRTVVQMADIKDPKLRSFLTESFVITDQVEKIFLSFFNDLLNSSGKGYFIEGNFGSGKSHLLSVISLLLSYKKSWQHILTQKDIPASFSKISEKVTSNNYIVINLSLVEHSNKEYLEDIITEEIIEFINKDKKLSNIEFKGEKDFIDKISDIIIKEHESKLKSFLRENNINKEELFQEGNLYLIEKLLKRLNLPYRFSYNRQQVFEQITNIIGSGTYNGLVILIDELSEFLRSKPDGRRFNEDIRFMQFLGEYAKRENCWVIASLQEEIEKTGETTPEAFNKIKDRYPNRFYLTGQHIKELIDKRLIEKKEGSTKHIKDIFKQFKTSFPEISFSENDFINLYPVHPGAIDLLDNLKPLFSQHRGIIDFIHYRLKGDSSRNIESMMDLSTDSLLTPDKIFDHFVDRIREMMETNPFYTKVYKYYEQEISSILDKGEQETGIKVIKLLILFSISPIDKKYTVKEIANMLFTKITDLDPSVNYEYIEDILNRLYQHGAYLVKEKGDNKLNNRYFIDLEADVNLIIKRRTEYIKSNLFENDKRLFTKLGRQVQEKFLPLNNLFESPRQKRTVTWQNTERSGYLYFLPVRDISIDNIKKTAELLTKDEDDFMLIISHAIDVKEDKKYLNNVLLTELDNQEKSSFIFWFPQELKEKEFLEDALAKILLLEKYEKDSSNTAQKVKTQLINLIKEETDRISKIFRDAYFEGQVINGFKESIVKLDNIGFLPFQSFLDKIVSELLKNRYPKHKEINPLQSIITTERMDEVIDKFISRGDIDDLKEISGRVLGIIDAFMKPMGLIKKRRNGVRLTIDPSKNDLIKVLFNILEDEKTSIDQIYTKLRKGSYGLSRKQFKILIYSLLYSGYLTAYSENKKISLTNLNARNFNRIKFIGYGELISEDFQLILSNCSLVPPRYRKRHFSLPLQQSIWKHLIDQKGELTQTIENLKFQIERLNNDQSFNHFKLKQIDNYLNNINDLLVEIKVSYSSEEGLERFAAKYRSMPNIENYLTKIEQFKYFIENNQDSYRKIYSYLNYPNFELPDQSKYSDLKSFKNSLLNSVKDDSVLFDKEFFTELKEKFNDFKREYIKVYQKEHQQQKGNDRFLTFQKLKNKTGYKVLKNLSDIELISVKDDLIKVDRMIAKAINHKCIKNTQSRLQDVPICDCGFKVGDQIELPSIKKIQSTIDSGVKQYINSIKQPENKEKIKDYIVNMEAAGNKKFAKPIRELLSIKIDQNLYTKLDKILNRNLIKRINSVLSGDVSLVERSLDQLYENLIDRSFSPTQIKQIFKEWLEGSSGISEKTYIKVKGNMGQNDQQKTKKLQETVIIDFVNSHYPELYNVIDHTDLNIFLKLFTIYTWKKIYKIDTGLENLITKISPESSTVLIEELKRNLYLKNLLEDMVERVYQRDQNINLKDILTEKVDKLGLTGHLLNIISPANLDEVLEAVNIEIISKKVLKELLVHFVKLIENIHLNYKEKSNFIKKTQELKDNLNNEHLIEFKEQAFNFIIHYLKLERSFSYLDSTNNINTVQEWKEVYVNYLANLEYNYHLLEKLSVKLDIQDIVPLSIKKKKVKQTNLNFNKLFTNFYDSNILINSNSEDNSKNRLVYLLNKRYPKLNSKMNSNQTYTLLFDGMKWDIWNMIKKRILKDVGLRMISEDSIFALTPSNTETQIDALKKSNKDIHVINSDQISTNLSNLDSNLNSCNQIIKFSFIDDNIHSSKDNYYDFLADIKLYTRNYLIPFLKKMEPRSNLLIISDHGFTFNYGYNENNKDKEEPRYLHGGKSFHEIIVPWALLYKP